MLNKKGKPSGNLFVSDSLHLSANGYDLWSKILKPALDSLVMNDENKIFGW
jgi:lysophospholipase L1-like esterase